MRERERTLQSAGGGLPLHTDLVGLLAGVGPDVDGAVAVALKVLHADAIRGESERCVCVGLRVRAWG